MNRNLPSGDPGPCHGAISLLREFVALSLVTAVLTMAGCGGGSPDTSGRSAPANTVGGTIAGLDEGFVLIRNGLDTKQIDANPDGLALDASFSLDTPLPAGAGYDVRIVNKPQEEFALQCDVINGRGVMPASNVDNVLVRCARVKSVRLLAGKIPSESGSRDGLATDARFLNPWGIAVDALCDGQVRRCTGNVYVADSSNSTIRRITPAGVVSTLAGSAGLSGSSDGSGADARFNSPSGIAVDAMENVYVADTGNSTIRRITPAGVVSTLAVTTPAGVVATFNHPQGVAVDVTGNVYVADTGNSTIRRITPAGVVSTLAGITPEGVVATFNHPQGVAVDSTGNVYVADTDNSFIRRISPAGEVSRLGAKASFRSPRGIVVDAIGNVYVTDTRSNTIRRITRADAVSTLAGNAEVAAGSDDGIGADARFDSPQGIAVDGTGSVYVADSAGNTIRRITPVGVVSTLAGRLTLAGHQDGIGSDAQFSLPSAIAVDAKSAMAVQAKGDVVYVADSNNSTIRRITAAGVVSTFAGSPEKPGSDDGTGAVARFNSPKGIAVDVRGNVYVADTNNSTIRRITPAGEVSTLAGTPGVFDFKNGSARDALFRAPRGIAVDAAGNVYVADTDNHTIRLITPAGEVSSLAGNPLQQPGSSDGKGEAASFNSPQGIAVDASGNVYVADRDASTIRRIATLSGDVKTIAGVAGLTDLWPSDGAGASARFNHPQGVAVDATGNVYVADSNHRAIRVLNGTVNGYDVRTVIGGPGDTLTRIGSLPQPIGVPRSLTLTPKRLYFISGDAVLFLDR